jgi:hypothetical protein
MAGRPPSDCILRWFSRLWRFSGGTVQDARLPPIQWRREGPRPHDRERRDASLTGLGALTGLGGRPTIDCRRRELP